jgi:hypothetical protein
MFFEIATRRFAELRIGVIWIPKNCNAGYLRQGFLEQLEHFACQIVVDQCKSGNISSWFPYARYEPALNRVIADYHYDRN